MGIQLETDITGDLQEWGKWARSCPSRALRYPSSQPFTILKGSVKLRISEAYAEQIDAAIAKLFTRDDQVKRLLILYFVWQCTYRDIERITGLKKDRAALLIGNSVSWLSGYLWACQEIA